MKGKKLNVTQNRIGRKYSETREQRSENKLTEKILVVKKGRLLHITTWNLKHLSLTCMSRRKNIVGYAREYLKR